MIFHQGQRQTTVPLAPLERLILSPSVELSAGVLGILAQHGVGLVVVNHRDPERFAILEGKQPKNVARRLSQYALSQEDGNRSHIAARLVRGKLLGQQRLLARMLLRRPDQRHPLRHGIEQLSAPIKSLRTPAWLDDSAGTGWRDRLNGIEGAAAAAYFRALSECFAPSYQFSGRNRRPPRDGVNALLSLSYTLLHHEAVMALRSHGLDPMLGLYHAASYGRESLACDLMEPLRPLIDGWIYRLCAEKSIRPDDFEAQDGGIRLCHRARQHYYRAYHQQAPLFIHRLKRWARFYATAIQATGRGPDDE